MSYELDARTEHPPEDRPVLVWDEECGFCGRWVERIRYRVGDGLEYAPYQQAAERFPDVPRELFARAVHLIETDGRVRAGAEAIIRAGEHGRPGIVGWCYRRAPGFATLAELGYGLVARNRPLVTRVSRWLVGPDLLPRQHRLTRWLFLRLLGITTLCAFVSLLVQWQGLFGSGGILPAADTMDAIRAHGQSAGWSAVERFMNAPTLAWLGVSDGALLAMLIVGTVLSVALIVDIAPGFCILGLWLLYLSIVKIAGIFLHYQWDILLLETLFVALFIAPWRLRPRLGSDAQPPGAGIWLVRLLCCKLMLLSALVKLGANDASWRELSALDFHFFTQPIATWTAYYVHHLPAALLATMTALVIAIELVLPFFVLGPRRLRLVFGAGTMLLMVIIGATGNYGFFNLLTFALAIMLFDDTALRRPFAAVVPRPWRARIPDPAMPPTAVPRRVTSIVLWSLAALVLMASLAQSCRRVNPRSTFARPVLELIQPFASVSSYGLFADMTTQRPEIVVEGSRDGQTWLAYEFRYKPTALDRRPGFTGPHMPRLDWQMWFAALRGCRRAPWLHAFLRRLLEGAPSVRGLLEHDPFGDSPPKYIRTTLYLYTFTSSGDSDWWHRERARPFCPTLTLVDGQLGVAR